ELFRPNCYLQQTAGLLRARRKRPRRRAAKQRDEVAPPDHSITSSAIASSVGRFEIDGQLQVGRLQHRQLGWLGAAENPTGVDASLPVSFGDTRSVAHQAASVDVFTLRIGRGNGVMRRQRRNLITLADPETYALARWSPHT